MTTVGRSRALSIAPRRPTPTSRRRAYVRTTAGLLLAAGAERAEAQGISARTFSGYRIELGAAASTPIVEDGNGVSLRRGIGPAAAGDAVWTIGTRTAVTGTLRGSVAPLHLRSMDRRWSGGWSQQLDLVLRIEHGLGASIGLGAGVVAAVLHGPDDLIPFRSGRGTLYGWGSELTVAALVSRTRRLHAVVGGDAIRISPPRREGGSGAGWIGRLRLGIRHVL